MTRPSPAAGRAPSQAHIDSREARAQNWTATFPAEFRARRGYDLRQWLPVLTGRVVGGTELSKRFLWDVKTTLSEMIRDNYVGRLHGLARVGIHGMLLVDVVSRSGQIAGARWLVRCRRPA